MANAHLPIDESSIERAERLIAEGRPGEAASLLQGLLADGRGGLLLRTTLASALVASGDIDAAVVVARETALLNPTAAIAAISLGEALLAGERLAVAIGEFQRALRLDPDSVRARLGIGMAWLAAGEPDKAIAAFETISGDDTPDTLPAAFAKARSMRERTRSDPRYVRHLFDEFAASYDARMLDQLSYGAPALLRQLATYVGILPARRYSILDLGCGTGLSGNAFVDVAGRLDGIDLSTSMIEKARERGIYDVLVVGDIEDWTADRHLAAAYDIILAADTLVYLGDLSKVLSVAATGLASGGFLLFTVERSYAANFELGPKRRWRHSENYLREQASAAGLDVAGLVACNPRTEAGAPVAGFAVALRNLATATQHD